MTEPTTPTTIAATGKAPDAEFDGPWTVNPFCAQIDSSRVDIHGDLVPVCQMLWPTDLRSEEDTGRFARLIATAPVLVEALRASIDAIEDDRGLDDYICCSGYMCGCQGSSKRQLMLHDLRAALSQAGGASE